MQPACLRRARAPRGKDLGVPVATFQTNESMVGGVLTDVTSGVAAAGVFVLAVVAPFEATRPLVRLPWQTVSNLEAAVMLSLAAWSVAALWTHRWPREVPLARAWLALLAAMSIAALAA